MYSERETHLRHSVVAYGISYRGGRRHDVNNEAARAATVKENRNIANINVIILKFISAAYAIEASVSLKRVTVRGNSIISNFREA